MAGNNMSEIRVAGSGRVLIAAAGQTLPATMATVWDTAIWSEVGYTSTEGVIFGKKDKIDPVDTWQAISATRFAYAQRDLTLKFQMMQFNEYTLPFFMGGGSVTTVDALNNVYGYDVPDGPQQDERSLGLEFTDGSAVTYRFIIPRGQVTVTEDVKLTRTAAALLGVTFSALSNGAGSALASFMMTDASYGIV